ncbi:DNA cytosine methyltransferase [Xanthomonas arboricola]|uniref:DNA cytosine methyltransferase n=2 Tax=Xanthomonas arboricola TaxID=56448 RepID=UPI0025AF0EA5|nr:DNA cytosine methyltransferase [Xanthomonas arboricola]MDN0280335.1 DNA cytosine methyltransferase [Xanthomonas arboricola pv. juglandis]CAD7347212.1 DNA cytosine methyltransferase [Xanthomonas arboricola]
MNDPILKLVHDRIQREGIDLSQAANAIGIGASALARHLDGEYVRSDSLAKYRMWLDGTAKSPRHKEGVEAVIASVEHADINPQGDMPTFDKPRNVVDLFCGCGGMSLGFERLNGGGTFRIAMALDIEEPMVKVFNDNHPSAGELGIARQADIADFMSEGEVQAYYLDHLARSTKDLILAERLGAVGHGGIPALRSKMHAHDKLFLSALAQIRRDPAYIAALKGVSGAALNQTSVGGFHYATKLPLTGSGHPKMGPLIWCMDGETPSVAGIDKLIVDEKLLRACKARARKLWDKEAEKLSQRGSGSGRGQLASAAERIQRFQIFLDSAPMQRVKKLWIEWRGEREALRVAFFDDIGVQKNLRKVYESGYQVSVVLGGPPCQGFSRIGRGKIRSLREQSVHVHEDEDSVDSRNQLMHQYVLFVAALAPEVFLFENVRHFQAVVKSEGIEFDAADILAEAIEAVSERGIGYKASSRIVVASQHAVPQNRERFVMAGVRLDTAESLHDIDAAEWCLALKRRTPVSLQVALEGLPNPDFDSQSKRTVSRSIKHANEESSLAFVSGDAAFRNWTFKGQVIDAHIARQPRPDDAAFFAMMGPGKRWMDYRADESPTLAKLNSIFVSLKEEMKNNHQLSKKLGVSAAEVEELSSMMDGSLTIRLLLECIAPQPGELQHHLLSENYLRKREGAHGDWMSRMDPSVPSKTIVSHMAKDTYAYVHPFLPRTLSVREAARVQSFPDDYRFGAVGLVDGFKVVGNAVPPLLSQQFAERVAVALSRSDFSRKVAAQGKNRKN